MAAVARFAGTSTECSAARRGRKAAHTQDILPVRIARSLGQRGPHLAPLQQNKIILFPVANYVAVTSWKIEFLFPRFVAAKVILRHF